MALPSSSSVWRAAKWLIKGTEYAVPVGLAWLNDALDDDADVADPGWLRINVRYSRLTPAGTSEDMAQFKFDVVNITGGAIDTTWTAGDFTALQTPLDAFATLLQGKMESSHVLKEYRGYAMGFNPSDPGPGAGPKSTSRPFRDTGPPVWVVTKTVAGTLTPALPYQVAMTATLKTGWASHWGRIYLPGVNTGIDSNGRWGASGRQTIANGLFDLQDDWAAAGFLVTVPVGQLNKQPFHALLGVHQVVVDDIPDVQRRRRPRQAVSRAIGIE